MRYTLYQFCVLLNSLQDNQCHFHYDTQKGDSAVIIATAGYEVAALRELVRAGSDLNLQNQVRYTVTVDTAPHIIPSCPY